MFLLKTRYATIIRIVAAILVPAFLVLDVAWANPEIFASKSTLARWAGLRDSGVAHEAASRYRDAAAGDRSFIVPVTDGTLHDVLERQNATSLTLPSDRILITDKAYSDNPSLLRALREHRQSVQATSEEPRATLASLKETELTPPAADKPAAAPDGNLVELAEVDEAKLESFLEGVELTDEEEEVIDKLFSFYEEHSIDDSRSKEGGTYAPTPTRWHIERLLLMCKKLGIDKGSRFYDLGHGNGMIAVIMAALGFKSCGDEINPQMARLADKLLDDIRNIPELARLLERKVVRIQEGDFLKNEHIPEFDVVYFYYTYPAAEEGVHAKRKFRDNVVAKLTGPTGLKKGAYFVTFQPPAKYWLDGTGLFDVIDAGYFKIYKLKDTTFGPHSAGAAELPSGTEPKMDYEVGTYEDRDRLEVGTGAGVYSAPEPSPEIHIEEAEKAFEELNKKVKRQKNLITKYAP